MSNIRFLTECVQRSLSKVTGSQSRRRVRLPLTVSLDVEGVLGNSYQNAQNLTAKGFTRDLSKNGIGIILPFIRLGEHYLAGHGDAKQLKIVLETPGGAVRMTIKPTRYEMIELHSSVQQYLIGAKIIDISAGDAERYADFLRNGDQTIAAAPEIDKRKPLLGFISLF